MASFNCVFQADVLVWLGPNAEDWEGRDGRVQPDHDCVDEDNLAKRGHDRPQQREVLEPVKFHNDVFLWRAKTGLGDLWGHRGPRVH